MNVTAPRFGCSATTPVQFAATEEKTPPQVQPGEFIRNFGLVEPKKDLTGIDLYHGPTSFHPVLSTKRFLKINDDGKIERTDTPEVTDDKKQPRFGGSTKVPVQFAGNKGNKKQAAPLAIAALAGLLSGIPMASQADGDWDSIRPGDINQTVTEETETAINDLAKNLADLQAQLEQASREKRAAELNCKDTVECYDQGFNAGFEKANSISSFWERKPDGSFNWRHYLESLLTFAAGGVFAGIRGRRKTETQKDS